MIAFIRGVLVHSSPLDVVVEAVGIGYKILIPASAFAKLPQLDSPIMIHTSLVIREQSQTLYGFLSSHERDLFEQLLGVTGIGPKLALNLIGHLSLTEMQRAIASHDIARLSKVPGVGKKTAERLIIELRDKLPADLAVDPADYMVSVQMDPQAMKIRDAMNALINLGYNQQIAQKAIKKTLKEQPEEIELAELISNALRNI